MQSLLRCNTAALRRPNGPFKSFNSYSQTLRGAYRELSFTSRSTHFSARRSNSLPGKDGVGSRWMGLGVGVGTVTAVGLHLALQPKVQCEPGSPKSQPTAAATSPEPTAPVASSPAEPQVPINPPTSSISVVELSFGTVCGICAGVFVKKGAKSVAFVLGGVFVLLQYLGSLGFISINWTKMGGQFEKRFYAAPSTPGEKGRAPTIAKAFSWIVDFLTADFPPRATFLAGFILGLRVG